MTRTSNDWRQSETLAWVAHDSPAPPRVRRWTQITLAAALVGVLTAMLSTDTLCPEHRMWVMSFGLLSIGAAATAFVQLLRGSWIATPLTLIAAMGGAVCGTIDMAHDRTRGTMIALGFMVVAVAAATMLVTDLRRLKWDHDLRPAPLPTLVDRDEPTPARAAIAETTHAAETGDATWAAPTPTSTDDTDVGQLQYAPVRQRPHELRHDAAAD